MKRGPEGPLFMNSQFLGWDIRDGSGDRHGDEDSSADDSTDIDGAGSLIEDAVEDWRMNIMVTKAKTMLTYNQTSVPPEA